eukprot:TRINITY_DN2764_c1_g2_i1.p1 TRINITY_DN2764_c1_g2~~TRINITY_DN2764_c1_g2_i1.p1  ORF type:complete len:438 (-),score=123.57 TRINITY_DN2764_c1_g2_i1:110-1423(-)
MASYIDEEAPLDVTRGPEDDGAATQEAMTLRVHGGGGLAASLATSGGVLPPHLEGIDSHVLDGACRARLTPEEKLEREVTRRRELELQRRARIFDAKRRTIGVDKEALDQQCADKERQRHIDRMHRHDGNQEALELDRQLKLIEAQKAGMLRAAEKEAREYSFAHLSKEQADTFDLNDPKALQKSKPMRVGDNDPRCGPASCLKFGGEDLMKDERVRQQHLQQANFIEQQRFEKAMMAEDGGADSAAAKEMNSMIALRNEMEAEEKAMRKALQKNQQDTNLYAAAENTERKAALIEDEMYRDMAELAHNARDPFLQETVQQYTACGRTRKSEFKGATREQKIQGRMLLEQQADEKRSHVNDDKISDLQFARAQENARRQVVLAERALQRERRAAQLANAQDNIAIRAQHADKIKETNRLYTNKFSDSFFEQFGVGTR